MIDRKKITIELSDRELRKLIDFLHIEQSKIHKEVKSNFGLVGFEIHRIVESVTEQLTQSQLGSDLYDQIKAER